MRKREGFTLVELLIVMAVIAALLATLTPVAVNAVKKAKATQVVSNLRSLAAAAQQYIYTEQNAPSDIDTLVSEGYIDRNPGDAYSLEVSGPDDEGRYTIEAQYTGGDVDIARAQDVDPSVKKEGNNLTYVATAVKYW